MYAMSIFSLIFFTLISSFLVVSSLINALTAGHWFYSGLLLMILSGLLVGHYREYDLIIVKDKDKLKAEKFEVFDFFVIIATWAGMVLTFYFNNILGMGGVVASALVGLLGPAFWPRQQRAIFCGSFAGMATSLSFSNFWWVSLAGLLSGVLLAMSREIYDGFGGKLGAAGFFGTISASLLADRFIYLAEGSTLNHDVNLVFYFILGAVITYYVNRINKTGTIFASSLAGLLAGLILPALYGPIGSSYAVSAFCGSFVGMTVINRLTNEFYLFTASFFGGIIFVYSQVNFAGLGGKLGTTAFSSVIAWWGLMYLYDLISGLWRSDRLDEGS